MQLKIPAPAQEPRTPGFSVLSGSELQVPPHAIQVPHERTQSVWCASAWLLRALQLGELQWVREGIAGMDHGPQETALSRISYPPARGLWSRKITFHAPQKAALTSITRINRHDDIF